MALLDGFRLAVLLSNVLRISFVTRPAAILAEALFHGSAMNEALGRTRTLAKTLLIRSGSAVPPGAPHRATSMRVCCPSRWKTAIWAISRGVPILLFEHRRCGLAPVGFPRVRGLPYLLPRVACGNRSAIPCGTRAHPREAGPRRLLRRRIPSCIEARPFKKVGFAGTPFASPSRRPSQSQDDVRARRNGFTPVC